MKPVLPSLIVASLLACASVAALAQSTSPADAHPAMAQGGMMQHDGQHFMHRMDPAKMQAMMAKHLAALKTKLKITAEQEGAWSTFTEAMKPPARPMAQRPDRAEMDKLSTPERIDKMHSLRAQRMADMSAAMDKREEAIKTFYATLSVEQKKVFDSEHARMAKMRAGRHGQKSAAKAASPSKP